MTKIEREELAELRLRLEPLRLSGAERESVERAERSQSIKLLRRMREIAGNHQVA